MKQGPPTPKGFRDILPDLAAKKRKTLNQIAQTFEDFGFVPLETPIVEFAETLIGKYGEEEKLIYQFKDKGGRQLALRYDLTVPLARFIANNQNLIAQKPFRRYQIGQVFRGEKPQKGRFREFTQFDIDSVGSNNLEEDAAIIAATLKSAQKIGLKNTQMMINDRKNFKDIPIPVIRAWDKLYKIGIDNVKKEIVKNRLSAQDADKYTDLLDKMPPSADFNTLKNILKTKYNLQENKDFAYDRTIARGLDYYTGLIFELKASNKPSDLSIAGGGRYDNLVGMFASKQIPAVGISFGISRLLEIT